MKALPKMHFETYPFEKLAKLLSDVTPDTAHSAVSLTIGEPQFSTPDFIQHTLAKHAEALRYYPKSAGEEFLRQSLRSFIQQRYGLALDNTQLIPTFGTREVLFNLPQFLLFDKPHPTMAFPNPFYQIYEGAAIASRATITHLNLEASNDFKPDYEAFASKLSQGYRPDLVILNSPNNPTGSTMTLEELASWVTLALTYDFILINDECYSEIYLSTPPPSILEASVHSGNPDFKNILALNSISKRSSAPGLRSGFIAGDASILAGYMQYRTYVGCAVPLPLQYAAAEAWRDETHVQEAREHYRSNFTLAHEILGLKPNESTFYLWINVKDDLEFTRHLYRHTNVKVLPGSFLGRHGAGEGYVRLALVYDPLVSAEVFQRIKPYID